MNLKSVALLCLLLVQYSNFATEKLTIGWDTSLSMKDRDTAKEFDFLQDYFTKYPNVAVTVLEFNNCKVLKKEVTVKKGNWQALKLHLSNVSYDGATSYNLLAKKLRAGTIFIFTDGNEPLVRDVVSLGKKPYIITSSTKSDTQNLQFLALSNKGRFIDLHNNYVQPLLKQKQDQYFGNIFSPLIALKDLKIATGNSETTAKSDGTYSIEGAVGEQLTVSAFGKTLWSQKLGDNKLINLWVAEEAEKLDEVVLKKKREITENEEVVETALGRMKKKKLGYGAGILVEEDIKDYLTLADALRGKFAGVQVGQDLGNVQLTSRFTTDKGSRNALVVIDGAPMAVDTRVEGIITPYNVASITILKGLAATTLYGSEGRNGVVLVTTKAMSSSLDHNGNKIKPKNLYKGDKLPVSTFQTPDYISELEAQSGVSEIYSAYLMQREKYWDHPMYLSDVYAYMSNIDVGLGLQIAYNVLERDSTLDTLRGLLLTSYKLGHYQLGLDVAYVILSKYPQQTQSYLDLAMAHKTVGNYQEALNRLLAIEYGTAQPALDFTHLRTIADNEIRDLIAKHKDELDLDRVQKKHLERKKLKARVVLDWSNRDAEFVITFINPDGLYARWIHTLANPELIENEVLHGFSQKEFEIDGGKLGGWTFNVNYLGNKMEGSESPTLLKYTIQHNYGTPEERTEQKVIRLHQAGSNEQFGAIITK